MTEKTYNLLQQRLSEAQQTLRSLGEDSEGHQRASLHDDAASENVKNLAFADINRIGDLSNVDIIKPRSDTQNVGIGNEVYIRFGDEEEAEPFLVLSPYDRTFNPDLNAVSYESPLGQAILGRSQGDEVTIRTPDGREIKAKIEVVREGNF